MKNKAYQVKGETMLNVIDSQNDYEQFILRIKKRTNIDLHLYKEDQMKRRLKAFKTRKGFSTFNDFYAAMLDDRVLFDEFLDHMTINVTEFFRNPGRWEVLGKKIIPDILSKKERIRCWSAACSTGEEPYSAAMVLSSLQIKDYRILATDINQKVMEIAKRGEYKESSLKNLSPLQISTFFEASGDRYIIRENIKSKVEFKQQNLLSDPFPEGFDLIICRNVLIYFTDDAKEQVFNKFGKALNQGGYLFVGGSEQIFQPEKYGLKETDTFFYKKMQERLQC